MPKFRKKPVVIEAERFDGTNGDEIVTWAKPYGQVITSDSEGPADGDRTFFLLIPTLEGVMRADLGDWIIRGVQYEHYPCKHDIFELTYEPVND